MFIWQSVILVQGSDQVVSEEQTVVEWLSTVCNHKKEEQGMLCKVSAVYLS